MNQKGASSSNKILSKTWIISCMIITLVGFGLSVYSTLHHHEVKASGSSDAACNINAQFSCDNVALSEYSEVLDIPLGIWGSGFFLALLLLLTQIKVWNPQGAKFAYSLAIIVGTLESLFLAYLSIFVVGSLCLSCIGVYICTLSLAIAWTLRRNFFLNGFSWTTATTGLMLPLGLIASIAFGYKGLQPRNTESTDDRSAQEVPAPDASKLSSTTHEIPLSFSAYSGLGEDYRLGSDQAKVTIISFSDFQCPACRSMDKTLKQLKKEFGDKILIVYKNYPLDQACNATMRQAFHDRACETATLARCAGQYGKFWQYHDLAFEQQSGANKKSSKAWAKAVGLNDEQIQNCLKSKGILEKIQDDISLGNRLGVTGTPSIFVNNKKYRGRGIQDFRHQINQILDH